MKVTLDLVDDWDIGALRVHDAQRFNLLSYVVKLVRYFVNVCKLRMDSFYRLRPVLVML